MSSVVTVMNDALLSNGDIPSHRQMQLRGNLVIRASYPSTPMRMGNRSASTFYHRTEAGSTGARVLKARIQKFVSSGSRSDAEKVHGWIGTSSITAPD